MSTAMPYYGAAWSRDERRARVPVTGAPAPADDEAISREVIAEIVARHRGRLGAASAMLMEIQGRLGYLPRHALLAVAEGTGRPLIDLYGIVSLSNCFTLKPPAPASSEREDLGGEGRRAVVVRCRHCHHDLVERSGLVAGAPAVRVTVSFGLEHGSFRFPALPDSTCFECEPPLPRTGEVDFFCPQCHAEVIRASRCALCGAPQVPRFVPPARIEAACASPGCRSARER